MFQFEGVWKRSAPDNLVAGLFPFPFLPHSTFLLQWFPFKGRLSYQFTRGVIYYSPWFRVSRSTRITHFFVHHEIVWISSPKIDRFVAQSAEWTLVAAFSLVLHPYSIMGSFVHPRNNPKQLQTIQAIHKCWRSLRSRHSQRWIFATALSKFMSFQRRKAQTDPQIQVFQILLTQKTLTNPIVLVRRSLRSQWSHNYQLIDKFVGFRCCTFTHAVEQHLVTQQQWDNDVLAATPS